MFPTLKMFSIPCSLLARGLLSRPNAASSKRGDTDPYVHPTSPLCLKLSLFLHTPTNRILARYKTKANLQVVDRCVPRCTVLPGGHVRSDRVFAA